MIEAALRAQAAGFHIFPVTAGLKVPHPKAGYRDQGGDFHGWGETSTNDINQILSFWMHVDPRANIGVACRPSGLLVVDLDQAKEDWNLRGTAWEYLHQAYGPRVSGEELFDEMAFKAGAGPQATYTVRTGSGGLHLYYRWPSWWPQQSQASPVKGVIDVRGNGGQWGGYVLGEGSVTEAGGYEAVSVNHFQINLPPAWVRQLVTEKPKIQTPKRLLGIRQPGAISWSGLVESVRNAGEGNRNNALLWASRSMCSDGATLEEAQDVLGAAGRQAGLGDFEIERTIESAYRIQRQKEGL